MSAFEKNKFKSYSICDCHCHHIFKEEIDCTVENFKNIMEYYKYKSIILHSLLQYEDSSDIANNLKGLYCKSLLNKEVNHRVYTYGSIYHFYDERDTAQGYLAQVKQFLAMGADGYKSLDGKPYMRKRLNKQLDDEIFDLMYAYLEENGIPVTMHLGDPPSFWDKTKVSKYAIERGWFCDESYPSLEQLRSEVVGVLNKFPKLKLCLAHLNFFGDELEHAADFLEQWQNVSFDLTPGGIMFVGFTKRHKDWKMFFEKYSDRLYYGTDTYSAKRDNVTNGYDEVPCVGVRIKQLRKMLEHTKEFQDVTFGNLRPLGLSDNILENIYYKNMERLLPVPREINCGICAQHTADIIFARKEGLFLTSDKDIDRLESENLIKMYKYFSD